MIIAIDLVEHVLCGTRIVERIGSVLKQNGKLLLEVPVLPRRSTSERVRGYRYLYPEHHLHLYTEEGIVGLVEVGGLLVVQKQVARHGKLKMLAERVA